MRKTPFILFILSLFILTGCNRFFHEPPTEIVMRYQENYEIIGSEKDEMLENVSKTIFETSDRSNSKAVEVEIGVVTREGKEIRVPSGRYQISGKVVGAVYIRDGNGDLLFRDILGSGYGVQSITIDLDEQHIIRMDGDLEQVHVSPVPTGLSTELTAGIWEVGLDIKEGAYSITTPYGLGSLQIFDPNEEPRVYEVIGGNFSATTSDVQLSDGQQLRINGISRINFHEK